MQKFGNRLEKDWIKLFGLTNECDFLKLLGLMYKVNRDQLKKLYGVMYYPIHYDRVVGRPLIKLANEGSDWYCADWKLVKGKMKLHNRRLSYHLEFDEFEIMTLEDIRMYDVQRT